jgi:alanyl-tRNA synthetase
MLAGKLNVSDKATLTIDGQRRRRIRANHTAAHLLQAALRSVLGEHVAQRGSFLNEERLRFDFSHNAAISADNLQKVETLVNEWIMQGLNVICQSMPKNDAIAAGAIALFGEKYGEVVRAVRIIKDDMTVSFELCGGAHASSTSEIGVFKILSESSIGSGVRRIEAITGVNVLNYLNKIEKWINVLAEKLKCRDDEITTRASDLLAELKAKNHEISKNKLNQAALNATITERSGAKVISAVAEDFSIDELRSLADELRKVHPEGIIIEISKFSDADKFSIMIEVDKTLQKKFNANLILKNALEITGGKGGGNAAFAQGGSAGKAKIPDMLDQILETIA